MRWVFFCVLLGACNKPIDFPSGAATWPNPAVPSWAHDGRFAITDNKSDQLSFVSADASKPAYFGAIHVGDIPVELEGPHHIAASKDGRYLYVNLSNYVPGSGTGPHGSHGSGTVPGSLLKLDAVTGEKLGEAALDRNPGDVILSADNSLAFVTHYDLLLVQTVLMSPTYVPADAPKTYASVIIVDTATMTPIGKTEPPVCPAPHGEGLSLDQKTLYVVCAESDELVTIDVSNPSAPKLKTRLFIGPSPGPLLSPSYFPYALAVSPKDGTVWISNNNSHDVRVYDPATGKMDPARTILLGGGAGVAMFGSFTKSGDAFYVPHQGDDRLTRIDTRDVTKTAELVLPEGDTGCLNAHAFVLTPDEQTGLVVCEGNHTDAASVIFVSVPTFSASGAVKTGVFSDGAAWLPAAP